MSDRMIKSVFTLEITKYGEELTEEDILEEVSGALDLDSSRGDSVSLVEFDDEVVHVTMKK